MEVDKTKLNGKRLLFSWTHNYLNIALSDIMINNLTEI